MRLAALFALCLCACAGAPGAVEQKPTGGPASPRSGPTVVLTIIGTNDFHGQLVRLPMFAGYVKNARAARSADSGGVLLVDAGDMFQGTLESNLTEGASVARAYDALGYHAAVLGNHEFDFGPVGPRATAKEPGDDPQGALKARVAEARFPVLAANVLDASTGEPIAWKNAHPTTMVTVAGVRVGLVGVITAETPQIVMPGNFDGLDVEPLAASIKKHSAALRSDGAEVVVVLAHAGGRCAKLDAPRDLSSCETDEEMFAVLRELPRGTVDAVVGGHTHQAVAHFVGDVPLVESYAHGRAFSRIDLTFDTARRRVVDRRIFPPRDLCRPADAPLASCNPGEYEEQPVVTDAALGRLIAPDLERARATRARKIGIVLETDVRRSYKEASALGNLFADSMLAAVPGADASIVNGGGIRRDLPAGELVYGAVFEAMPFDNLLARVEISGADLSKMLAHHMTSDRHGIVSLGGVRATARCVGTELTVALERSDGRPIVPEERLGLVTSDYLATGGDGLFSPIELAKGAVALDLGETVRDAVARVLQKRGGRLRGDDPQLLDPKRPRLSMPSARPVRCSAKQP